MAFRSGLKGWGLAAAVMSAAMLLAGGGLAQTKTEAGPTLNNAPRLSQKPLADAPELPDPGHSREPARLPETRLPETRLPEAPRLPAPAPPPLLEPDAPGFRPAPREPITVRFSRKPTDAEFDATWPAGALKRGVSGVGTIQCRIGAAGVLENCRQVSETPPGQGFGAAALALSRSLRVDMTTRPSPAGTLLTVPVRYNVAPRSAPPFPWPKGTAVPGYVPEPQPQVRQPPSSIDLLASETNAGHHRFHWRQEPAAADFLRTYPQGALANLQQGEVMLDCRIGRRGDIEDCRVTSEYPEGLGFGAAAIALTASLKARPEVTSIGQRIVLPVVYRPPSLAPPPVIPTSTAAPPRPKGPPRDWSPAWPVLRGGMLGIGLGVLAWLATVAFLAIRRRREADAYG